MYYAIISEDINNSLPLRKEARPAHVARLEHLRDEGRLLVAGPHPALDTPEPGDAGFTGSLVMAAGVYAKVTVKPFKPVLP